ncbi:MAG: alpha-L-arabinofuranosidase C-terminal domain-containing protein [Candidatus Helarchaeota archaeon]
MVKILIEKIVEDVKISRLLLGHFIEHLGMCIENGIWLYKNTGQPLMKPPLDRVRVELFELMKDINPPVIRYPGGCFSDTYHWKDGIGPRDLRPIRKNKAWGGIKSLFGIFKDYNIGPIERNHFGTFEFLTLCERLMSEKYININFGSGTPQEAADWVEYANGSPNSTYGRKRVDDGHLEPFFVKFWGIGNEIFGWWEKGHCKFAEVYAKKYLEFARAMKNVDPNIKLMGVGWNSKWNRTFLELTKGWVDFLTVHIYLPVLNLLKYIFSTKPLPEKEKVYYSILNSPYLVDELLTKTEQDITSVYGSDGFNKVKIALDEYNIWYRWIQVRRADKAYYTLRDGLWTACVINTLIKHAKFVGMANFAQMVNTLGMILTYDDKIIVNPHYLIFKMYSDAWIEDAQLISAKVECPDIISEKFGNIPILMRPVLDVASMISKDMKYLTLFIINKHLTDSIEVLIEFDSNLGFSPNKTVNEQILTHKNPFITNTRENPNEIKLKSKDFEIEGNSFKHIIPAHSATVLKFSAK